MDDKNSSTSGATENTAPSARAHHAGDGGAVAGGARRLSVKRKLALVQRLLRGESLEAVSREENVPVHRLTAWRDKVLMGAESALAARRPAVDHPSGGRRTLSLIVRRPLHGAARSAAPARSGAGRGITLLSTSRRTSDTPAASTPLSRRHGCSEMPPEPGP